MVFSLDKRVLCPYMPSLISIKCADCGFWKLHQKIYFYSPVFTLKVLLLFLRLQKQAPPGKSKSVYLNWLYAELSCSKITGPAETDISSSGRLTDNDLVCCCWADDCCIFCISALCFHSWLCMLIISPRCLSSMDEHSRCGSLLELHLLTLLLSVITHTLFLTTHLCTNYTCM